ncbi:MAG: DNA (cytosine-5-)-methyltransferase [Lachnospiraceae bacterium]|nr:DNA (cytosine-5-)-methyltransferase [Lachnospiraceae bacterium]
MIYKTIDLCAGIGGIRRGFEMTEHFENVLSAEIDPYAAATYKHLFGDDPTNDLTSEEFKNNVDFIEYDVLLAGFPCQTFSRIGKQLGFRDSTRGTIFFDIADIISRTNPRAVFLENVENLVSHDHGNTIETIINTLEDELGYRVIGVTVNEDGKYVYNRSSLVRNTKDFGLPQNRPRVYIMAFSKKKYGKAIKRLNGQLPLSSEAVIYEDVIAILDHNVDDKYYMAQGYLNTLKKHKARNRKNGNGFGYCVVNQTGDEHPIAYTILATGGSGKERNLIYQPKPGISGKELKGKKTKLNSEGIRIMTPDEWGRLQGFIGYGFVNENGIDEFDFPEGTTDGQKYKQFGNSVSIPVIRRMAEFMLECFETLEKQQVEVIRALAENNEFFTKRDAMEMLDLNAQQAGCLLKNMVETKELLRVSKGKTTRYIKYQKEEVKLSPYSQEEKVIKFAEDNETISNDEVRDLLGVSASSANVLLSSMVRKGTLKRVSRGRYKLEILT